MKKIAWLIVVLVFTGCEDNLLRMAQDEAACHNHSGVYSYSNVGFAAECKDGSIATNTHNITSPLVAEYLNKLQKERENNVEKKVKQSINRL